MILFLTDDERTAIRAKAEAVTAKHRSQVHTADLLRKLADENGIEILEADLFDMAGALRREEGKWRIYINRQDSHTRQLFTLAHELAHYFLHKEDRAEFVDGDFVMNRQEDTKYDAIELEANEFAGNLIMPAQKIEQTIQGKEPTERQVLDLADRFKVSPLAVVIRLRSLGYAVPAPAPSRG